MGTWEAAGPGNCRKGLASITLYSMTETPSNQSAYEAAGVSIDRGNRLVSVIQSLARETQGPETLAGPGGFGALFDLSSAGYKRPVLVSGADGVGTKIKLAVELGRHDSIGIDLVAMCVNDVLAQGAEPLFFLDYFACSRLEEDTATAVIAGIAQGCKTAGCALVGGETAEMPGMYQPGEYDLAGFCVGAVEKDAIITGETAQPGDALIALPSSGPHANGFSLIRKILADSGTALTDELEGVPFADLLLAPTRIYKQEVLALPPALRPKGIAHITGGGLTENLPRALPAGLIAEVDCGSWQWPALFKWLQTTGDLDAAEMRRAFNCGVGMVLVVDSDAAEQTLQGLRDSGAAPWRLGAAREGAGQAGGARYLNDPV